MVPSNLILTCSSMNLELFIFGWAGICVYLTFRFGLCWVSEFLDWDD